MTTNARRALVGAALFLAAFSLLAMEAGTTTWAQTNYYWDGSNTTNTVPDGGVGTWNNLLVNWRDQLLAGGNEIAWVSGANSIANFGNPTTSAATSNITLASSVTLNTINFTNNTGNNYSINSSNGSTITFVGANPTIGLGTGTQNTTAFVTVPVIATSQLNVIDRELTTGAPVFNFGNDSDSFTGGILIDSPAKSLLFNFAGITNPSATMRVNFNTTTAGGAQGAAAGDITIAANGIRFSNANTAAGLVRTTYNHIILNSNNLATPETFVIAMGATNASGGGNQNTLDYIGDISGPGSVIIGNDVTWQSGGAAFTVFSGTKKHYTGLTIMNGSTAAIFKIGADNVLPDGNVMQFGAIPTGANSATPGNTGALDLNGHVLTVAAIRTKLTNTVTNTTAAVNGITNTAAGQATLIINGSTSDIYGGGIGITASNLTAGAGIANDNVALTRTGTGSTTISLTITGVTNSTSTYFGPTNVNGSASLIAGSVTGFSRNSDYTVSGDNSFGGSGIATLDLNGFNNTINSLSGTASGAVTNNSSFGNAVLTIGNSASPNPTPTASFSGVLQDGLGGNTLALTKAGGGTQTLAATNNYTGPTTINAGTLSLASTGSIATGSVVAVNANGTLAGTGSALGNVEVKSSGTIAPGSKTAIGTLTVGSLQLDGGSVYSWKINDATGALGSTPGYDALISTGPITLDSATVAPGNAVVIKLSSLGVPPAHFNSASNYSWPIAAGSSLTGVAFDPSLFSVNSLGFKGGSPFASFNVSNPSPGVLQLNYAAGAAPTDLVWVGPGGSGGSGSWDPSGGTSWNDGMSNTGWNSSNAADFNAGNGTVTLSAPISAPFIKFDTDGYTIAGSSALSKAAGFNTLAVQVTNIGQTGTISAPISSPLTLIGSGTLVLTGSNTFGGGAVNVNGGTLQGDVSSLGGHGTTTSTTNITNNTTVVFDQAVDATYAGTMDGSGSIVKQNIGKLTLTGNNSYAGGTTISGGTLRVSSDANLGAEGGPLTFNGGTLNLPGVNSARPIVVTAAAGSVLDDTGSGGGVNRFSGGANFAAGGVLTKTGNGTLNIIASAWGGAGGIVVNQGGILVGDPKDPNSNPSTFLGGNSLTFNNGTTLTIAAFSDSAGSITPPGLTLNGNVMISLFKTGGAGGFSPTLNSTTTVGGGLLLFNSSGDLLGVPNGLIQSSTVTLGATTFNGDTTIQTVAAGSGGASTGVVLGVVTDNGHSLNFYGHGNAATQVDPGTGVTINAVSSVGRTESGNWTIGDANDPNGKNAQIVTLNAQHATHPEWALTTGNVIVNSGSQLDIASLSTTAIYGPDAGMQTITLNGLGPAHPTKPNTFLGALFVASRAQPVFNSSVNVVLGSDTQISLDNSNALIPTLLTFNGPVTGSGNLTLTAGDTQGEMFFSGPNNLTGGTKITGGKLVVNGVNDMLPDSSMGSGDLTMAQSGGQNTDLIFYNTAQSVGNLRSIYAGSSSGAVSQEIHLHGTVLSITQTVSHDYGIGPESGATPAGSESIISGTGSIVLTSMSTAELTLSDPNNSYHGSTTINGGSLAVSTDTNLGTAPAAPTPGQLTLGGGQFHATGGAPLALAPTRGFTAAAGGGTLLTDPGTPLTIQGPTTFSNPSTTLTVASNSYVKFSASVNAASVASGASVTVASGATLELAGTASALSDGVTHVDVVNNSRAAGGGLLSTGTDQNVGFVSGTGDTAVATESDLTASGVVQNSITIGGDAMHPTSLTIRASSSNVVMASEPAGGASGLALAGSVALTSSPFGSDGGSNTLSGNGSDVAASGGLTQVSLGGKLGGGSAAVPEPATWLMIAWAAAAVSTVRRWKNRIARAQSAIDAG